LGIRKKGMKKRHLEQTAELPTKEELKFEKLRTALSDARYIMSQYGGKYREDAWETVRKILFDPSINLINRKTKKED
jgi:hypothetical protein